MRLVSLCPSLTELVFDLGAGDSLVGRTRFCVRPAGMVERVERVGGTKNPKVARVIELDPDLVLMNEEENRREDADALRQSGVRVHSSLPRTAAETAEMVRTVGRAIAREAQSESIACDIEARAARVQLAAEGRPPVAFAYLIWRKPWMTLNADTYVNALLALAGGRNVFADLTERYAEVSIDALVSADPALVLLSSEPFPFTTLHADELATLTRVPRERFVLVDGELLSWHGSRTPLGIDYAEGVIAAGR